MPSVVAHRLERHLLAQGVDRRDRRVEARRNGAVALGVVQEERLVEVHVGVDERREDDAAADIEAHTGWR